MGYLYFVAGLIVGIVAGLCGAGNDRQAKRFEDDTLDEDDFYEPDPKYYDE